MSLTDCQKKGRLKKKSVKKKKNNLKKKMKRVGPIADDRQCKKAGILWVRGDFYLGMNSSSSTSLARSEQEAEIGVGNLLFFPSQIEFYLNCPFSMKV